MSSHNLTIDCPICGDEIELEVSVGSWGYAPSFDDPGSGPEDIEWETPKSCDSCKNTFTQEQFDQLHNAIDQKIDRSLSDWESDLGSYAAEMEAEARWEDLKDREREQGEPRNYPEFYR